MLIKDFINTDFKEFSNADNVRSIPSVIDGLKDSQRKAVFGLHKHGNSEIKVAQLSGFAALVSQYEHGEASMSSTIVGLAQDYPGSNNVNLFEPIGQFGSILSSESAAARYIYTKPSKWLHKLILSADEGIIEHREDDGNKLEPINYYPIIPLWIVNGSIGVGTGHAVKILPRDPKNVISMINRIVKGTVPNQKTIEELMTPSFTGWKGTVTALGDEGSYEIVGCIERINTTTLRITELPIGMGIDKFKDILVTLLDSNQIRDYDNNSTESSFDIEVKVTREVSSRTDRKLLEMFKLVSRTTENVTLWNTSGCLERYQNVYEALCDSIHYRMGKYEQRRLYHIQKYTEELKFMNNKMVFIEEWNNLNNPGKIHNDKLIAYFADDVGLPLDHIDKLLQLRISSLTMDQINKLKKECLEKENLIKALEQTTQEELYTADLKDLPI